ncbi:hypothetical protein POM88_047124 [Heracleum sosnowskyi]|uniref:Uncharacterized protein n=1 Tax=Heracleum sosnowskyi TaxID=360622 RepID=A0AAD8HAT0_9APIA|nr:hypothetical protein POM88_047124 [Heracleum sosnowskyi]
MPARIGDCSVDSCLTTNESPVPPIVLSPQAAILKKKPRPMLSNADLSLLDSSLLNTICLWPSAQNRCLSFYIIVYYVFNCNCKISGFDTLGKFPVQMTQQLS